MGVGALQMLSECCLAHSAVGGGGCAALESSVDVHGRRKSKGAVKAVNQRSGPKGQSPR
jgi:hypothetical protein